MRIDQQCYITEMIVLNIYTNFDILLMMNKGKQAKIQKYRLYIDNFFETSCHYITYKAELS